ncbi:NADH-ubiquinone oxidoreductase-F iron-sulfur binding region domain-containing protein [Halococcus sp. AFM35]|uniref:NADH-ubiquinone oxidoreductase-F iron-sulfur binding region domain-containing protein n=1 Tax=Halococcus sp. AFM35 TaxID=3421653 RepID=UPI003EBA7F04
MATDGIIGTSPAVRVAAGSDSYTEGQELLSAEQESGTAIRTVMVGSTGFEDLEPLVLATLDGETAFFPRCSTEQVQAVVAELDDGTLPTDRAVAVAEHESGTATLPIPDDGPLGVGDRNVLSGCGWAVPTSIADYRADGTTGINDENLTTRLRDVGLRGRGRGDAAADEPVVDHWKAAAAADGDPVVVVNAHDADPHAAMDRLLLESDPFAVCEPALVAAAALDATDVVVYVNETETIARRRIQEAANALVDEFDMGVSIRAVTGPDEYKAGEPTMALEAIEGNHRLEARRQPPGPSEHGLDGRPTLVHTPRTFAQVGAVLDGEDVGASSDPGTRLFTVAGDVEAAATVELSTDATLDAVLPAVETETERKAACVGGVFGGLTRSLDVPASAPGLRSARLGTNGVVEMMDDSTCTVAFVGERAKFAREENCGRCVPCREGSKQLVDLLRDVYDGEYKDGMLRELARTMRETSICGFGREAARPVTTAMETFETEFNAHARGNCPTGACNHS